MMFYRIARGPYKDDLSGEGAEKYGGRWNSIGTRAFYCCENRALALLEILANAYPSVKLKDYYILTIEVPDNLKIYRPKENQLPTNWNSVPMNHSTQLFGDAFIEKGDFIGMQVPSTIMPYEYNIVLNPLHEHYKQIKIKETIPFYIDIRL
jgi:RES domain-containing protein